VGGYGPGTVGGPGSGFAGSGLPGSAVGAGSRGGLGPGYGTGAGGNLSESKMGNLQSIRKCVLLKLYLIYISFHLLHIMP